MSHNLWLGECPRGLKALCKGSARGKSKRIDVDIWSQKRATRRPAWASGKHIRRADCIQVFVQFNLYGLVNE